MDLLGFLHVGGMGLLGIVSTALLFLAALTFIVFIHEFGHFQVGRWCGVKVDTFSIGFGREIFGWNDRHGTRWRIAWIPLGGYVKFAGDANAASMPEASKPMSEYAPDDFHGKPVWQRALVVAAGPVANYILAIVIFAAVFMLAGYPFGQSRVDDVQAGSAADKAGIRVGDVLLAINGSPVRSFFEVQEAIMSRMGETVVIDLDRDGEKISVSAVVGEAEVEGGLGGTIKLGRLGVTHDDTKDKAIVLVRQGPLQAASLAVEKSWRITETTLRYIGKLFTGRESTDKLGGVMSMASGAGNAASVGFAGFTLFVGLLSVSIGLINLFPIPILDGGHLVFYAIETVTGRPLGPAAQEWSYRIGFAVVIAMMLIANLNDVLRLGLS